MVAIPLRGDIFWVNLDPTIGSEIRKKRPALVEQIRTISKLRLESWAGRAGEETMKKIEAAIKIHLDLS